MAEIFIGSLLLGSLAGLSAGLFGIGGGVLIVPFLSWLFVAHRFHPELVMLMAVATSLATAIFTSAASANTHYRLGNIVWPRVFRLSPSLLFGALAGTLIAKYLSVQLLRTSFIAYLVYTGLNMALPKRSKSSSRIGQPFWDYPIGFLIGSISALLGIGGGTMTVPYLATSGQIMRNAVATSSACALPIAFAGAVSYILLGWQENHLPDGSVGYIYLPAFFGVVASSMLTAPLGARLAHGLPAQQLKRYFALVLLLIALKMALTQGT